MPVYNTGISEKEFAVIREVSNGDKPTQRHVAKELGISLGLINLIIKRLVKKGFIKIQEAPARTIVYTLTPKGMAEKTRKSYEFTLKTIGIIKKIKENIQEIINQEYKKGIRKFVITGSGEISAFTEIAFRELNLKDAAYSRSEDNSQGARLQCHLILQKNGNPGKIDIISELSRRSVYH